ncbi:MAG: (2Fe-2S) ferredoxin domain-containing protein [Magnetococcales bacterium]|nr:(2Fe-2S) ferredoxin domain-containing protein [Magnetococcales bacterium]
MEQPFYDIHLFCCVNTRDSGHVRGSCGQQNALDLHGYLKSRAKQLPNAGRIRINTSGCLDRCELGPVMVIYPQGIWYHYHTQTDLDEILNRHIVGGALVQRLLLTHEAVAPP